MTTKRQRNDAALCGLVITVIGAFLLTMALIGCVEQGAPPVTKPAETAPSTARHISKTFKFSSTSSEPPKPLQKPLANAGSNAGDVEQLQQLKKEVEKLKDELQKERQRADKVGKKLLESATKDKPSIDAEALHMPRPKPTPKPAVTVTQEQDYVTVLTDTVELKRDVQLHYFTFKIRNDGKKPISWCQIYIQCYNNADEIFENASASVDNIGPGQVVIMRTPGFQGVPASYKFSYGEVDPQTFKFRRGKTVN